MHGCGPNLAPGSTSQHSYDVVLLVDDIGWSSEKEKMCMTHKKKKYTSHPTLQPIHERYCRAGAG